MKKYLVIIAFLTSSALAESEPADNVKRKSLYFKLGVGASKLNKAQESNSSNDYPNVKSNISKSKISPTFTIGFGGYINDIIREEIELDYSRINFQNSTINTGNMSFSDEEEELSLDSLSSLVKREASVYSTMAYTYIDLPIAERVDVFLGAGVGLATIKEKFNQTWTAHKANDARVVERNSSKSKHKINFAYALTAGTSLKVTPMVNLDISYKWKDFGKTKYKKDMTENHYRGHMLMAGIRVGL